MYQEKCTKHEAILKAQDFIGAPIPEKPKPKPTPKPDKPEPTPEERSAFLNKMFIYFKNAIYNSPPAKEYLSSRKLDYTKTEVGYNSGQFHQRGKKNETDTKMYQSGVVNYNQPSQMVAGLHHFCKRLYNLSYKWQTR